MYPKPFQRLIEHFSSLPSIGPRLAERLTLHLFREKKDKLEDFAEALTALRELHPCERCFHIAENHLCGICRDENRDGSLLLVVEEPLDVIAFERTGRFRGRYHVLGGVMSGGKDTGHLHVGELLARVPREKIKEVILATNLTTEGDFTALYLSKKLEGTGAAVSRLARGLSTGGDIEYADEMTLSSALERREQFT